MTKYNLDLLEVIDNEAKLINYLRMEKWLADRPHHAAPMPAQLRGIPRFLVFVPEWIRSLPHLGMLQD